MSNKITIGQVGSVENRILLIRGGKVIIDADLAEFYRVSTKRLREQIRRNKNRFPDEFMFKLTRAEMKEEADACSHLTNIRYSRTTPYALTEHGAIMAATVLDSEQAVEMSIFIVRAFVKLRGAIASHKELADKIRALERRAMLHDKHIVSLVKAIKQLIGPSAVPKKRQIGFNISEKK